LGEKELEMLVEEPDIAFWFGTDDERHAWRVEIREGVTYEDLVLASIDLLAKALRMDDRGETLIGEYRKDK